MDAAMRTARIAYFEGLLRGQPEPFWRQFYQSQIAYYQELPAPQPSTSSGGAGDTHPEPVEGGGPSPPPQPLPPPQWRGKNEAAWAGLMAAMGVEWRYEALESDISRAIRYMPDFWLPGSLTWLEIKSEAPSPGEIRLARLLREATGRRVYLVDGWPWRNSYGLSIFDPAGDVRVGRADWRDLALCQLFDCTFGALYEGFNQVRQGRLSQ